MTIAHGSEFDFDAGSLIQSPCKMCENQSQLPACMENCRLLGTIQQRLATTVSSHNGVSELESFRVILPSRSR